MWKNLGCLFGFVLAGLALVGTVAALMFRFEESGEYERALRFDVVVGFMFAVSIALMAFSVDGMDTRRRRCTSLTFVFMAWALVSGWLAWCHYRQHAVRSTPLDEPLPWIVRWL
jgi:hypothetical protein